jgi:uncharacterized protein
MKVFMTGANGFVGTNLCAALLAEGHDITAVVRSEGSASGLPARVSRLKGDPTKPGEWQNAVPGHDVLINLAGASIFKRWSPKYKQLLRDSRLFTTRNLVDAIPAESGSALTLLSTSAVGYYGATGDEELDESSPGGDDFLARLAQDWEAEALRGSDKGARVALMRFGVVLGRDGGALEQMVRPFRLFAGGPIGNGRQWFSWIHVRDLCRAVLFLVSRPDVRGPVNFTAPAPVRNRELARSIGKVLHRPAFMPAPGFIISLVLGEFGSVILKGQRVVPGILTAMGFRFEYPDIDAALRNCLVP